MEHKYIKLVHNTPGHEDWFVVNWCMGNTCNFECSYCPNELHSGSIKWPELDKVKEFITRIVEQVAPRKVYFELTGGEVTLYKHFVEICKHCTELGAKVGLISNGSRTLRWWEDNKQYFDHVCLSFHPEFAEEDHFVKVVKILHDDVRTHVNIMMSPEKFSFCYAIANKIKNITNISMALQPLIHDFGTELYEYTAPQKNIFDKQHELIVKHIKYTKSFDYYRGAMKMINEDGTQGAASSAHRFLSEKTNDWSGWKCYMGVEQIIVDLAGDIFKGWCRVGGKIGNIFEDFEVPKTPVLCNKTMCHCNFDIMCTKERVM